MGADLVQWLYRSHWLNNSLPFDFILWRSFYLMRRALLQDRDVFPQLQTPRSKLLEQTSVRQTHQRPASISQWGAFNSSKPADWSSTSSRFVLSRQRDSCLASSLPSLCISCPQLLFVFSSTAPFLLLSPSVACILFPPFLLLSRTVCDGVYSTHQTRWFSYLWSLELRDYESPQKSFFSCSDREMPASLEHKHS